MSPSMELVIHILAPLTTYWSPCRLATVRMPCRSVPASGSVSARPPRSSPVAKRGSQWSFCFEVPNFWTIRAIIRWELKKPVRLIHSSEMRATILE